MADLAIDTEGTFRPERIMEIAERFGGTSARPILDAGTDQISRS